MPALPTIGSGDVVTQAIDHEITATGTRAVCVNLSELTFLDSWGISVLIKGRREADKTGVAYRITGATDVVRHILSLTGVLEHLSADCAVDSSE